MAIPYADTPYIKPMSVDEYLNNVDFSMLDEHSSYVPSKFALMFLNFIKLVNDGNGEDNKTPVMHLIMLDNVATKHQKLANLCARGVAKTTLFMEYLTLYLATFGKLPNFGKVHGMLYVSDSMENGVASARKSIEFRYDNSEFLQYWVPYAKFTEKYLEFRNRDGHRLGCKMFGAKSGIRGTKIFNKRPVIAIMDDLVSDADSKSKTAMESIKDTVYSGVQYALDPNRYKMILNGTPFNKHDVVYEAIESGAWLVNVWPICERFPCTEKEFRGSWPDRFTYKYVKAQYDSAVLEGKLKSFRQELMLRITSAESRLVQDEEISWSSRAYILKNKHLFNFYITTDFATSSKQTADYSVISVWAYDAHGNWHWVDGVCARQRMNKAVNDLFRLAQEYKPEGVGIETSGQQGGFVDWIMEEMNNRDIYFTLTKEKGKKEPGIKPTTDKLSRFNMVVPLFKKKSVFFPEEMRTSRIIGIALEQIQLVTEDGIKGMDDFIDTISMLQYLSPWKPTVAEKPEPQNQSSQHGAVQWGSSGLISNDQKDDGAYASYVA